QERFYRLWEAFAARYGAYSDRVVFELLNEVTDPAFMESWNQITHICVRRIRAIAPEIRILVGGYHNSSVEGVAALDKPDDGKVIYNFHCYDPLPFTHQGAYWVPQLDQEARVSFDECDISASMFIQRFKPALDASEKNHTALYCGEYGVIDRAAPEDALKWYQAIHEAFEKLGIGRCAWSYREMDFGIVDSRMDGVRAALIQNL
ncbi:MAG: cellulase family glycosylhydrolase, partial [Clostridia bacterium]|nr:cellulase family glycosylhydrolase [Clostridia bacterium]